MMRNNDLSFDTVNDKDYQLPVVPNSGQKSVTRLKSANLRTQVFEETFPCSSNTSMRIFENSRTLQSIKQFKNERIVSSQNILEIPLEYDLNSFKMQRSDTTKLFCAVKNFYQHQETLEQLQNGKNPLDDTKNVSQARRKVREIIQTRYTFEDDKAVKKDLWKIRFLQRSSSQMKLRQQQIEDQKKRLDKFLQQKMTQLHLDEDTKRRRASLAADKEFIEKEIKVRPKLGSQLKRQDFTITTPLPQSHIIPSTQQRMPRKVIKVFHRNNSQLIGDFNNQLVKSESLRAAQQTILKSGKASGSELRQDQAQPHVDHLIDLHIPLNRNKTPSQEGTFFGNNSSMAPDDGGSSQLFRVREQQSYQNFQNKRKRSQTADGQLRNVLKTLSANQVPKEVTNRPMIEGQLCEHHLSGLTGLPSFTNASLRKMHIASVIQPKLVSSITQVDLRNPQILQSLTSINPVPSIPIQIRRRLAQQSLKQLILHQINDQQKLLQKKKEQDETIAQGLPPKPQKDLNIHIQGSTAKLQEKSPHKLKHTLDQELIKVMRSSLNQLQFRPLAANDRKRNSRTRSQISSANQSIADSTGTLQNRMGNFSAITMINPLQDFKPAVQKKQKTASDQQYLKKSILSKPMHKFSPHKSRDPDRKFEVTGTVLTSDIAIHANQNQDFSILESPGMDILDFPVQSGEQSPSQKKKSLLQKDVKNVDIQK